MAGDSIAIPAPTHGCATVTQIPHTLAAASLTSEIPQRTRKRKRTPNDGDMNTDADNSSTMKRKASKRLKRHVSQQESDSMSARPKTQSHDHPTPPASRGSRLMELASRLFRNPSQVAVKVDLSKAANDSDDLKLSTSQSKSTNPQPPTPAEIQRVLHDRIAFLERARITARQDALLDLVMEREKHDKEILVWKRKLHRAQSSAKSQFEDSEQALHTCREQLNKMAAKYSDALGEAALLKEEKDNLEAIGFNLKSDLMDLRDLNVEEAECRSRQRLGLPPTYDNHLDMEHQPPYQRHKDAGACTAEKIKQKVQTQFYSALKAAHIARASHQKIYPEQRRIIDSMVFRHTSQALLSAYRHLSRYHSHFPKETTWVIDLMLSLSWSVIGACELRPTIVTLSKPEASAIALVHYEIDKILETRMEKLFKAGSKDDVLDAYNAQRYLVQVRALRQRFLGLNVPAMDGLYLEMTMNWLDAQVEVERQLQARDV